MQGPNKHDLLPLERVIDKRSVNETAAIKKLKTIQLRKTQNSDKYYGITQKRYKEMLEKKAYQSVKELHEDETVIFAWQIMTRSVQTLASDMTVDRAITLFRKKIFRHLPVVSSQGVVNGIVSVQDVLYYMAHMKMPGRSDQKVRRSADHVDQLMQSPVLTAVENTDIRYIARLFVERRVGAMPIVSDGHLTGIITRSDILRAVVNNYDVELWI